jgi:hypothetical protein
MKRTMRNLSLCGLLFLLPIWAQAGTVPTDTLWTIYVQYRIKNGQPTSRVAYYQYQQTRYRARRQGDEFVRQRLVSLIPDYYDSPASASLARYFRARRQRAAFGYGAIGGIAVGSVLHLIGTANVLSSYLPRSGTSRDLGDRQIRVGTVLSGLGVASGVVYVATASRPRRMLHRTIDVYNESLERRINWSLSTTGTGFRLVGTF